MSEPLPLSIFPLGEQIHLNNEFESYNQVFIGGGHKIMTIICLSLLKEMIIYKSIMGLFPSYHREKGLWDFREQGSFEAVGEDKVDC